MAVLKDAIEQAIDIDYVLDDVMLVLVPRRRRNGQGGSAVTLLAILVVLACEVRRGAEDDAVLSVNGVRTCGPKRSFPQALEDAFDRRPSAARRDATARLARGRLPVPAEHPSGARAGLQYSSPCRGATCSATSGLRRRAGGRWPW